MNKENLLRLADFLENVLPPEKFYFGNVVKGVDMPRDTFDCGSVACAIGWTPIVFPELVQYYYDAYWGELAVRPCGEERGEESGKLKRNFLQTGEVLFDLDESRMRGLFDPGWQRNIGERDLSMNASAKEVAAMIRRFVEKSAAQ